MALSKALFNKNSAETFWALLEEVYGIILKNPFGTRWRGAGCLYIRCK